MIKLDRLGWADGIAFRSYGLRVGVRVTDRRAMKRAIELLPPDWKPVSSPIVDYLYSLVIGDAAPGSKTQRFNLVYFDAGRLARSRDLELILKAFKSHLHITVANNARRRVFVHAGVVGWKENAILLPGSSSSGKTTLVSSLVKAGATYYSDKYAVLDECGLVHPFPRPLAVREDGGCGTQRVQVETIRGKAGSKPLPVGLVVSTSYREGAKWRPRQLTTGRGVLELLSNTVSVRSQTNLALAILPRAIRAAEILKGVRGEADEIVESILERVA